MYDVKYWKRWQKNTTRSVRPQDEKNVDRAQQKRACKKAKKNARWSKREEAGWSFGKAKQRPVAPVAVSCDAVPIERGEFGKEVVRPGGAIGMGKREMTFVNKAAMNTPGPGDYGVMSMMGEQKDSERRSARQSSFGIKTQIGGTPVVDNRPTAYGDGKSDLPTRAFVQSHTFATAPRSDANLNHSEMPGPGKYDVKSTTFETNVVPLLGPKEGTSSYLLLEKEMKVANAYKLRPVLFNTGYGHKCDHEEHIKYGKCINGNCSLRATWETGVDLGLKHKNPLAQETIMDLDLVHKDRASIMKVLVQLDLNECDECGRNVLHAIAAEEFETPDQQLRKLDFILNAANSSNQQLKINAQDENGRTPLHLAVETEQVELVEALLKNHADPELEDHEGITPLQLATDLPGKHKIYQLLRAQIMMYDLQAEIEQVNRAKRMIHSRRILARLSRGESTASLCASRDSSIGSNAIPFGGLPSRGEDDGPGYTDLQPLGGLPSRHSSTPSSELPPSRQSSSAHGTLHHFGGLPSR